MSSAGASAGERPDPLSARTPGSPHTVVTPAGRYYVVYYAWGSTRGNHAGMAYLCETLARTRTDVELVPVEPVRVKRLKAGVNLSPRWAARLNRRLVTPLEVAVNQVGAWRLARKLRRRLRPGDGLMLMEIATAPRLSPYMEGLAGRVRGQVRYIMGCMHLPVHFTIRAGLAASPADLKGRLDLVDTVMVFGSGLAEEIERLGARCRVFRTCYYADTEFYRPAPASPVRGEEVFLIACVGHLMREFGQLREIAAACPEFHFAVSTSGVDVSSYFQGLENVRLMGRVPEQELLALMQSASVSLNVMEDTVGSNVITASLATGLPMVVSDVGSIRDYCTPDDTIFCRTTQDFVEALRKLHRNPALRRDMARAARAQSERVALPALLTAISGELTRSVSEARSCA